ncbi:MAG: YkuS family protein [Veillonellales bacterium]
MQGIIAVERNLSKLMEALETEGYDVVDLDHVNMDTVDAVIVSGADINLMNMQDIHTNVPVIHAAGKSSDEILEELERL